MQRQPVSFWIDRAKIWADTVTNNPKQWRDLIGQLELVLGSNENLAPHLVDLLCYYAQFKLDSLSVVARIGAEGGDPMDRPPLPMIGDLVSGTQSALTDLGPLATEALLNKYQETNSDDPRRIWIVRALAEVGDITAQPFFDNLKVDDLKDAVAAEDAVSTNATVLLADIPNMSDIQIAYTTRQLIDQVRFNFHRNMRP